MYQGKHSAQPVANTGRAKPVRSAAPRRRSARAGKSLGLILALALILCVAIGGTVAWLTHQATITNTMSPGSVPVSIFETKGNNTKTQITLTNEGDVPAYLRVAVISNTLEDGVIKPGTSSYSITPNNNWVQLDDGYYYYKGIVYPGDDNAVALLGSPIPYGNAEVVVMAQTVQALGTIGNGTASQALWGHTYSNGSWT